MALSKDSIEVSFDEYVKVTEEKITDKSEKIENLESELARIKKTWTQDISLLNGLRIEKENSDNRLTLFDRKWEKLYEENEAHKQLIQKLQVESKANLKASSQNVSLDKYVTSASKSMTNLEIEYQKELQGIEERLERQISELREQNKWLTEKYESERQHNFLLNDTNRLLQNQIEGIRKNE